jgi:UDP-2,3-diacylglucosamine hydrolase
MEKIYFLSDSHLGIPDAHQSLVREKKLVRWLEQVSIDASEIFLLGDLFDFWFEYRDVVPKGYIRLFGAIARLTDRGIPVHYFTGNHDMWESGYFESELGLIMHRSPVEIVRQGKTLYIGHGDGLGPGDLGYKLMKRIFSMAISRKLFSFLHPRLGIWIATYMSGRSRRSHAEQDKYFLGEDKEILVLYSKDILQTRKIDYFVFGHRHYPVMLELKKDVYFLNTGDWISNFSYAVMGNGLLELKYFHET